MKSSIKNDKVCGLPKGWDIWWALPSAEGLVDELVGGLVDQWAEGLDRRLSVAWAEGLDSG